MNRNSVGKRSRVGFWWHFDRIFGDSHRVGWQVLIMLVLVALLVLFITGVGWLLTVIGCVKVNEHDNMAIIQSIGLAFGTTNLPGGVTFDSGYRVFPLWWQAIAALLGAVLFSGVTITFVGNLLGNRQEAYRNGSVRYKFTSHLLILGGGEMVVPILKDYWSRVKNDSMQSGRHVVVLTERDAAEVRQALIGQLSDDERKEMKITVLRGRRDDADEQRSVFLDRADRIYIVGEDLMGDDYDSVNIAAYREAAKLCQGRRRVPCYLQLERVSSEHIFLHDTKEPFDTCFETVIVNRLETVAQSILVKNSAADGDLPPLDRGGIGLDSERTVHLVLYGMTAFSYAMATTAAHLCHFPNFFTVGEQDGRRVYTERPDRRTRITFMAPNIKEEMNYLQSHLNNLFRVSKVTVDGVATVPDEDFLDVEWEFVDGNIASPEIRALLEQYYRDNQEGHTYLTLALCQREARQNMASALYLPDCFHRIYYTDGKDRKVDYERTIPIFVYQPGNEVQLERAHKEVPMYRNIFPVGSMGKSYDPSIRQRISEGKRIHYIYDKGDKGEVCTAQAKLDDEWARLTYINRKSNIYCANQVGVKLRSIGNHGALLRSDEPTRQLLAAVEHSRWNVGELLMGYGVVDRKERERMKQLEREGRDAECQELKEKLKGQRDVTFCHECIAPYEQLLEKDKTYDRDIVKYLPDIIENEK